jgi:hypothetical protein
MQHVLNLGDITMEDVSSTIPDCDLVSAYIAAHEDWVGFVHEGDEDTAAYVQEFKDTLTARFTAAHWEELHARRS